MADSRTRAEAERKRYGAWSGCPDGAPYDPARCAKEVHSVDRASMFYQCTNRPGHGPDGLYCRPHSKQFAVASETWWKLSGDRIDEAAVVSVTEKRVTLLGGRSEPKNSQWGDWFPTKLEALKYRALRARREYDRLRSRLETVTREMLRFEREAEEEKERVKGDA